MTSTTDTQTTRSGMTFELRIVRKLRAAIGAELQSHGGILRCHVCQAEQPLGDTGQYTATGWPKHCGTTMTWITQRLLDEEAVQ